MVYKNLLYDLKQLHKISDVEVKNYNKEELDPTEETTTRSY